MKFASALTLCGVAWTLLFLSFTHFILSFWLEVVPGVATAFTVGYVMRSRIRSAKGWRWFALPFISVALGAVVFALLTTTVMFFVSLADKREQFSPGAFFVTPLFYLAFALTYLVWATYPASLITHYLLRYVIPESLPNQSTDPTLASGTSGAGHQPRHP